MNRPLHITTSEPNTAQHLNQKLNIITKNGDLIQIRQ